MGYMKNSFSGRVALVTGGSFGIGAATALAFAREGAQVVIADINSNPDTLRQLQEISPSSSFIHCDVSQASEVERLIDQIGSSYGRLDFAFNNAGIEGDNGTVDQCTESNWDRVLAVNLKSVYLCMHAEIALMLKQGSGAIVNCASVAGLMGFANLPAYVASKHGVVGLTRAAALENASRNIRINAVCPGVIRTQMVERVIHGDPELEKAYTAMEPIGRMGRAEEVADAVLWLCSDGASFMHGAAVPVDGGMTAG